PALFPSINAGELTAALTIYKVAIKNQQTARAAAQRATETKNAEGGMLNSKLKQAIKQAEADNIDDPGNMVLIGWGPKAPPTPIVAPGAPTNLRSTDEGFGTICFNWDKPRTGGVVRNYSLYRTTVDPESGLAQWTLVGFYYTNEITVENQPRGTQLYYMVNAVNAGGTSPNSNTLAVVL
ncbi:MAG: fibronectin type III domain-containing protein, partial [Sedimentisphaerales bacterium]|nr:fibronectin type III domain-containing protein [Sedimentisphaerales bacterium]